MKIRGILWIATLFVFLVGQTAFPADLDNNGIEDSYEQALAEKFCLNYRISLIQESKFSSLLPKWEIVYAWQDEYKKYSRSAGELYNYNGLFLPNSNFLSSEDTSSNKYESMEIGRRLTLELLLAYTGGYLGFLTVAAITGNVLHAQEKTGLEGLGTGMYMVFIGGTVGIPVGSAVLLNIPMPKYKRFSFSRFGWTLLGASLPIALTTTVGLLKPGHYVPIILICWCLAPAGAVIGYNLAD